VRELELLWSVFVLCGQAARDRPLGSENVIDGGGVGWGQGEEW